MAGARGKIGRPAQKTGRVRAGLEGGQGRRRRARRWRKRAQVGIAARAQTSRPRKKPLDKVVENDLIAENQQLKERNQYLEAELEYLKKLDALVRAEEQKNGKKQ